MGVQKEQKIVYVLKGGAGWILNPALLFLLLWEGTPSLYQGNAFGMRQFVKAVVYNHERYEKIAETKAFVPYKKHWCQRAEFIC